MHLDQDERQEIDVAQEAMEQDSPKVGVLDEAQDVDVAVDAAEHDAEVTEAREDRGEEPEA